MNLSTQLGSEFFSQPDLEALIFNESPLEHLSQDLVKRIASCFSPVLQNQESYAEFESLVEAKYGQEIRQSVDNYILIDSECGVIGEFFELYSTIILVCEDMMQEIDFNNISDLQNSGQFIPEEEIMEFEKESLMFSFVLPANFKEVFQNFVRLDEADQEAELNRQQLQEFLENLQSQRQINKVSFVKLKSTLTDFVLKQQQAEGEALSVSETYSASLNFDSGSDDEDKEVLIKRKLPSQNQNLDATCTPQLFGFNSLSHCFIDRLFTLN